MTGRGIFVETLPSQECAVETLADVFRRFKPDVIHVYHAFRAGSLFLDLAEAIRRKPAVVASPGGTDINSDFEIPERRTIIERVFELAGIIVAQSSGIEELLRSRLPGLSQKIARVPKSFCWFGDEPFDLRRIAGCDSQSVLFFLPAGIRPVKGNLECLLALEKVHKARPRIRFVAAGSSIDQEYGSRFEREMTRLSEFAIWIKGIAPAAMRSSYAASDVVINSSFSEGLSNSLLEAVASGRPILASNIQGNLWPVLGEHGDEQAGLLYNPHDAEDFAANARRLIDDDKLRISLGLVSKSRGAKLPRPEDEADGLIAAYEKAIESGFREF